MTQDFLADTAARSLPDNAYNMGSIPDPEDSTSHRILGSCATTTEPAL